MKAVNSFPKLLLFVLVLFSFSCSKEPGSSGDGNGDGDGDEEFEQPVDPAIENTIGFFLDDWSPRNYTTPASFNEVAQATGQIGAFITIDAAKVITKVPSSVFGQNANIWMSPLITEPALIGHLANLEPKVIRFPGGSLSDVYFWNCPSNQPPADAPAELPDENGNMKPSNYWFGKINTNWSASVDNFYAMLAETGNEGMITVNYGYARYGTGDDPVASAAHLAAEWVRYDNGRTKYWEVGNECNGTWEAGYRINTATNKDAQPQIITGELYGKHFKVFADSMHKAAQEIGKTIYVGAYILEKQPASWQTPTDHGWNNGVLKIIGNSADFYVVHNYFTNYKENSGAETILNTATNVTTAMMEYVKKSIIDAGAAVKPVALTEWNITSEGSRQQVSFVNGMHAAILLGESIKNKYGQTSRWDLANGWSDGNDHGLFNIGDEPGVSKWNPRPAFYYMYYFKKMFGDRMISTSVTGGLLAYASSFTSGHKGVVIINKSSNPQVASITCKNFKPGAKLYYYSLTGGTDNGEFSSKVFVNNIGPSEATGGPSTSYTTIKANAMSTQNGIKISVPRRSVLYMVIDK